MQLQIICKTLFLYIYISRLPCCRVVVIFASFLYLGQLAHAVVFVFHTMWSENNFFFLCFQPDDHWRKRGGGRQRRKTIPTKPIAGLNLWSIIKNCIGKELSKIPVPVSEPLSKLMAHVASRCNHVPVLPV